MEAVLREKFPRGLNNPGATRVCLAAPIAWRIGLRVRVTCLMLFDQFVIGHRLPVLTLSSVRSSSICE
ncbi:hypothetical protein [uncultured Sphingomonas sp.]|uniref:hypothetical protein n=1 Tax=uncultured Sphingomonas sp. TaxID=158754 RepID=UPI003748C718